jgi:hypothetical protein
MDVKLPPATAAAVAFAWHFVIGAVLFLVVSLVAVALSAIMGLLESAGLVPIWLAISTHYLEIAIYSIDVAVYALFLVVEAIKSVIAFVKDARKSHG